MAANKKYTDSFWNDVDRIASVLKLNDNFSAYWELEQLYDFMEDCKHFLLDKIHVPLCNRNIVKKSIKLEHKIVSYLIDWRKLNNNGYNPDNKEFKDWFFNEKLTIYRGIPARGKSEPIMSVNSTEFKSATLSIEIATRFTQVGWGARGWIDMPRRNGWILVGEIVPANVHIFCQEASESECVIKGEYTFNKYLVVEKGILVS